MIGGGQERLADESRVDMYKDLFGQFLLFSFVHVFGLFYLQKQKSIDYLRLQNTIIISASQHPPCLCNILFKKKTLLDTCYIIIIVHCVSGKRLQETVCVVLTCVFMLIDAFYLAYYFQAENWIVILGAAGKSLTDCCL